MSVYVFNLLNSEEISDNPQATPQFEELGPYVFTEVDAYTDGTFFNNTFTYNKTRSWYFDPSSSSGSLDDEVVNIGVSALVS